MDLEQIRRDYELGSLPRKQLAASPHEQFALWLQQAIDAELSADPTAMTIATVDAGGVPSQRVVLLKGNDSNGLRFFTNKNSHKARDLAVNPNISAHFSWLPLERQVQITGTVEPLSEQQNDAYFRSRPKASQIGALASNQSAPIASRELLDQQFEQLMETYRDSEVPRPEHWGGYLIKPSQFEFWQGGRNRLHDRFTFTLTNGQWAIERLQP
ncbi:MAG: pyridoxamine 5'-phosphate oxidase [Pseudomonadota bacterium]